MKPMVIAPRRVRLWVVLVGAVIGFVALTVLAIALVVGVAYASRQAIEAAREGNLWTLRILMPLARRIQYTECGEWIPCHEVTALGVAAANDQFAAAQLLLDHGARKGARNALHFVLMSTDPAAKPVAQRLWENLRSEGDDLLFEASSRQWPADVAFLVQHGADPNGWARAHCPLTAAVDRSYGTDQEKQATVRQLVALGARIDGPLTGEGGHTPLLEVLQFGGCAPDAVAALLVAGANPNTSGGDGVTPLEAAVDWGCSGAIEPLLHHGADATRRTSQGLALVELAQRHVTEDASVIDPDRAQRFRDEIALLNSWQAGGHPTGSGAAHGVPHPHGSAKAK